MATGWRRWIAAFFVLAGMSVAGADGAQAQAACPWRKAFHESGVAGSIAYLRSAHIPYPQDNREDWCPMSATQILNVPRTATQLFFALNNRNERADLQSHFVVKIYRRRTAASRFRSILTLGRTGRWSNSPCGVPADSNPYSVPWTNAPQDYWGTAEWTVPPQQRRRPCNPLNLWLGEAFGNGSLSLARRANVLRTIPQSVMRTGTQNWTLELFAWTYQTTNKLAAAFPDFSIARSPDEDVVVQIWADLPERLTEIQLPHSR